MLGLLTYMILPNRNTFRFQNKPQQHFCFSIRKKTKRIFQNQPNKVRRRSLQNNERRKINTYTHTIYSNFKFCALCIESINLFRPCKLSSDWVWTIANASTNFHNKIIFNDIQHECTQCNFEIKKKKKRIPYSHKNITLGSNMIHQIRNRSGSITEIYTCCGCSCFEFCCIQWSKRTQRVRLGDHRLCVLSNWFFFRFEFISFETTSRLNRK